MEIPLIKLSGSSINIGRGHGEGLRQRIMETWDFYRGIVRADDSKIKELSLKYLLHLKKYFPELVTEMEGISEGSNIDFWKIVALNCRTELIRTLNSIAKNECTVVYSSSLNIIGQTWDWSGALEDLAVMIHLKKEDEKEILMMTEPGIVGKIGVNNHGVAVGLTILKAPVQLDGIPIHVLLRAALESKNRNEAKQVFRDKKLGTTSTVNVIFSNENPLGIEVLGEEYLEYTTEDKKDFCHTNHYLATSKPNSWEVGPDMESSLDRLAKAQDLLENAKEHTVDKIKSILKNKEGKNSICHDYKPDDVIGSDGTVARIILDPNTRSIEVALGTNGEYARFCI